MVRTPQLPGALARVICSTLVIAGLLLGPIMPASAADEQLSTSISPVTFELTGNPGDTLTNIVKVTNISTEAHEYKMEIEPFIGNEVGQATVIVGEDPHPELALKDWMTLAPATFTLAPKAQQLVTVTIKIPKTAEPGGRYGTILASAGNTGAVTGTGAKVNHKVGTLTLLRVQGVINYQATLKSFEVGRRLYERSPISFKTRLHNASTVHIKPKGFITLSNTFGRKVADIAVDERNALPDSDRLLTTDVTQQLPIGRYTASLALIYGDKNETLTATTSFIVFPWKTGVPIIIGIIALLWFMITRRARITEAIRILAGKR